MLPRRLPVAALLILLGSCATPKPAPPPQPVGRVPLPVPAPIPVSSDWRDWPVTPGDWSYARNAIGSEATFGSAGQRLFTIICGNDRQVHFERPIPFAGSMTIRTSSTTRALPTDLTGHPASGVVAKLSASDPLLDAMGYSRGRFVVQQAGLPPLVVPAWAEVLRVIEDCRG